MGMCPALCTEIEKEESKCSRIYAYQKQKSIPQSAPEELPFGIEYMVERKEYFFEQTVQRSNIHKSPELIEWPPFLKKKSLQLQKMGDHHSKSFLSVI